MTILVLHVSPKQGRHKLFTFMCNSICIVINRHREQFDVLHIGFAFLPDEKDGYLYIIVESQKNIGAIIYSICESIEVLDSIVIDSDIQFIDDVTLDSSLARSTNKACKHSDTKCHHPFQS